LCYHRTLPSIVADWQNFLRKETVAPGEHEKAKYLYHRSSLFTKQCARVLASLNLRAQTELAAHAYEQALRTSEQSLRLVKSGSAVYSKVSALYELGRYDDVLSFGTKQLSDSGFALSILPIRLFLGDSFWSLDSLQQAADQYRYLLNIHATEAMAQRCAVRLEALQTSDEMSYLQPIICYTIELSQKIERLSKLRSPLARYLLAHEEFSKNQSEDAAALLRSFSFSSSAMEFYRLRLLGRVLETEGEWKQAGETYALAGLHAMNDFEKMQIEERMEECRWAAGEK
jgi:tetratricopeptide (TPR) repeat protein